MNENDCISKCYQGKSKKLHPLYLVPISSNKPFCLINNKSLFKNCDINNTKNTITEIDYYIPRLGINEEYILKNIYEITNWEECKKYFQKNKKINNFNINRILTFCWIAYYKNFKTNSDVINNIYQMYIERFGNSENINVNSILSTIKNIEHKHIHKYIINKIFK